MAQTGRAAVRVLPAFTLAIFIVLLIAPSIYGREPKEGYSKVMISNRYLTAQPNASAPPALSLLSGLDGEILEEYDDSTLGYIRSTLITTLRGRAKDARVEVTPRDDYDFIYVNGLLIDSRLGTARSVPAARLDPSYASDDWGTWVIQFSGPMKRSWVEQVGAEGVTLVQYLPYHSFIAAARESAIRRASALPFVQYIEQMHAFMKPSLPSVNAPIRLWVQLAETPDTADAVAMLRRLSVDEITHHLWSATERRVEGRFAGTDVERIVREPLVIAVTERPTIGLSDERVSISLTDLTAGTNPRKYKKWLADLCGACGNLKTEGYRIGIADTGLDGGSLPDPTPPNLQIFGEPWSSGDHRVDLGDPSLDPSRIIYGQSFALREGPWPGNLSSYPDTTETKHDVHGHGTLVAGIAAGDPGIAGSTDPGGFYWGLGVAPSAGLVITKIDHSGVGVTGSALVKEITRDAWNLQAYIQNHSYNQYVRGLDTPPPGAGPCWSRYDGYYSTLSRDFDLAVRDADDQAPGHQPIFVTVSAGNVDSQGRPDLLPGNPGCPDRFLTLPPATAKNVLALGMAENLRPDSHLWNCFGAPAESHDNIGVNGKTGTAVNGWIKPDLMAAATSIASSKSYDIDTVHNNQPASFCVNGTATLPSLPTEYIASTGTSFAAPAAAGAALLASRFYAQYLIDRGEPAGPATASPALLKAMLIAGAKSMLGGKDRSRVTVWRPGTTSFKEGDLVIPRTPNGRKYRAMTPDIAVTCSTEPVWLTGVSFTETCSGIYPRMTWQDDGPEDLVGPLPNSRQGFGRLHLGDVLSSYPARDFVNQTERLVSGQTWPETYKAYKVHDGLRPVRIALVWTDPAKAIASGTHIPGPPLVNDLDLSVEFGSPCTSRFLGNWMSSEVSLPDATCTNGTKDILNNVEIIQFFAPAGTEFTVKVNAKSVTATGSTEDGKQDFALVVLNAHRSTVAPPPSTPVSFVANALNETQVRLSWMTSTGAVSYEVQRSTGVDDPYVTVMTPSTPGPHTDNVSAGKTYLYRVRARNATGDSAFSAVDAATTVLFENDPLVAGQSTIRAAHITQLRDAIGYMRTAAGLTAYPWTDTTIVSGVTPVKAAHVAEMRLAVDAARNALELVAAPSYTDSELTSNQSVVRAVHVHELRERVQ